MSVAYPARRPHELEGGGPPRPQQEGLLPSLPSPGRRYLAALMFQMWVQLPLMEPE